MKNPTSSLKALSHRYNISMPDLRFIVKDLGLKETYQKSIRSWVLFEDAQTVVRFNNHLAELVA